MDTAQKAKITNELENSFGGDVHVHENTWPGLYGIISAMQALLVFLYGVSILFILVVTLLTAGKILWLEQKDMCIYKAIGFRVKQLRIAFALRFGIMALLGSAVGTALAACLTDPLVSAVMKLAGISNFSSHPTAANVLFPMIMVTLLFPIFAYLAAGKIGKKDVAKLMAE